MIRRQSIHVKSVYLLESRRDTSQAATGAGTPSPCQGIQQAKRAKTSETYRVMIGNSEIDLHSP
jgi:hypothetical protein